MFLMPPLVKPRRVSLTRTDGTGNSSLLTTQTFTGLNIGTAAPDREVIVVLSAFADGNMADHTETVTIAGGAATLVTRFGVDDRSISIYRRNVPTGTTADIVATYTSAVSCLIYVYRLVGAISNIPLYTNTAHTSLQSINFTASPPANSVALMAASAVGVTGTSHTWTGSGFPSPTTVTGGYNGIRTSAAREEFSMAGTNLTFTAQWSNTNPQVHQAAIAIWQ